MSDTPVTKGLLNAIHSVVHWMLHIIFIPIVAVLKASVSGLTHLLIEAEKL